MWKKCCFLLLIIAFTSCNQKSALEKEIEKIPISFEVVRFDEKFAAATPNDLPNLKAEFPYLFPAQYPNEMWIEMLNDTIQTEINTEVAAAFPNFEKEEEDLQSLFQHIKYYFQGFEEPLVITLTSQVDYKNKVIFSEDFLLISLDTYLGEDHKFYLGIQEYLKKNFEPNQIIPDVAEQYARSIIARPTSNTLLDQMVYYGKILYLKDLLIPSRGDHEKIGYTEEELDWAKRNEEQIWRYFVEREIIFNADTELHTRFINPAPFTKFYLELDHESPARLGQYIGWQIVRQYVDKTDVSIQDLIVTDAETIFNNANYKPKK